MDAARLWRKNADGSVKYRNHSADLSIVNCGANSMIKCVVPLVDIAGINPDRPVRTS